MNTLINTQENNSIRHILKWAVDTLKKHGIEFPDTNAHTLLSYVLSCDKTQLYANPDKIIKDENITKYKKLVNKRLRHMPLQYITGHVEFMSLDFVVDERALIPRQETEILVETVLNMTNNKTLSDKMITIMDIGTGCGNIAVSLAINLQNAQIYASDVSKETLDLAKINIRRHKVADRICLFQGNLFEAFDKHLERGNIDFIVSNPPYVCESEWNRLDPEIKEHEPRDALVGGKDGLCFYKQIIKDAPEWLKPKGFLILETGESQAEAIIKLAEIKNHFDNIEITKDLQKKERIFSARRK